MICVKGNNKPLLATSWFFYQFARYFYAILVSVVLCSCTNQLLVGNLTVTESMGIPRSLEYIEIEIVLEHLPLADETFFIKDETLIEGQILSKNKQTNGTYLIQCLFPITINAEETKRYQIILSKYTKPSTDLKIDGEGLELRIENNHYVADLTSKKATEENGIGAGQLSSLSLKLFENLQLERSNINMHWAPSFQKKGLDYKTMAHLRNNDSVSVDKGPYQISTYRSGKVEGYEEIQLEGQYQFYAGLPYFIFSSSMTMVDDVVLTMLRNDEMTMDSLFTHAMFPLPNGDVKTVSLYDAPPLTSHYSIKELRKTPIDANTDWFCFYSDSLKYGFGSIRLAYDYANSSGDQSPMIDPETRVSYAAKGGRYWDRRFVFSKNDSLSLPKRSRYYEKNAYVIFQVNSENPSEGIVELFNQLTHPVRVVYNNIDEE